MQSVFGIRDPQLNASPTSLQGCGRYVVVVSVVTVPVVDVAVAVEVVVVVVEVAVSVVVDVEVQATLHITWHKERASSPRLPCTVQSAACTRSPHTSGSIFPLHRCRLYVVVVAVVSDMVVVVVVVAVTVVAVAVEVEEDVLVGVEVEVLVLHPRPQRRGQCIRAKMPYSPLSLQSDGGMREPQICATQQQQHKYVKSRHVTPSRGWYDYLARYENAKLKKARTRVWCVCVCVRARACVCVCVRDYVHAKGGASVSGNLPQLRMIRGCRL